jgi:hypothetical protein
MRKERPFDVDKYVPSAWTKWFLEQNPRVEAKNPSGDTIIVDPWVKSRWDWTSKKVTADCVTCPLFVSQEQAENIARLVRFYKRDRKRIPRELRGICTYGQAGRRRQINKFLRKNQVSVTQGCKIGSANIEKRVEMKRKNGLLK